MIQKTKRLQGRDRKPHRSGLCSAKFAQAFTSDQPDRYLSNNYWTRQSSFYISPQAKTSSHQRPHKHADILYPLIQHCMEEQTAVLAKTRPIDISQGEEAQIRAGIGEHQKSDSESTTNAATDLLNKLSLSGSPLAQLPKDGAILLLTPYLQYPPPGFPMSLLMDPFEKFGQSLTAFHSKVWHMPYVAQRGLIDEHRHRLADAAGVIFIVYNMNRDQQPVSDKSKFLHEQNVVSKEASELIKSQDKPGLLLVIGEATIDSESYTNVWKLNEWQDLERVSKRVF